MNENVENVTEIKGNGGATPLKLKEILKKIISVANGTHAQKYFDTSTNGSLITFVLISFFIATTITGYLLPGVIITLALLGAMVKVTRKPLRIALRIAIFSLIFFCTFLLTEAITATVGTACAICVMISYKKKKRSIEWASGMILPIFVVFFAEYMQGNLVNALRYFYYGIVSKNASWYILQHLAFLIGIFIVVFVTYFFNFVFNSKKIAYYATGGVFGILIIVNFFVVAFTSQPFTFSDIKIATTAAGVLNSQALPASKWVQLAFGIILMAAYFAYVTFVYRKDKDKCQIKKRVPAIALLCFAATMLVYVGSGMYSSLLLFNANNKYGFITNLFMTLDSGIKFPDDVEDYILSDEDEDVEYKPNVIIIMDEAFSDLQNEFGIECTEEVLPYFHSLQEKYPSGTAYTSVRGNNTCSSEWEVLSGVSTALTAKGAMIYQDNCKPMNSLVSLFNNRGYSTYGFHPYYAHGYNRESMWKTLGFNKTVFLEDMPNDVEKFRGYVTDEADFKYLISLYEENEAAGDAPFFCMNVTMQNHGGYLTETYKDISTVGVGPYDDVNTYLTTVRKTDEALKTLIDYFENVDEDTIILFFGDHQPLIDDAFYEEIYGNLYGNFTIEQVSKVYSVPYLIWSNYELEETEGEKNFSVNYLTSYMFEVGGIEKNKWLEMVTEYREAYPVITTNFAKDSEGRLISTAEILQAMKSSNKEDPLYKLYLYQKYCYGVLYGKE